MNSTVFRNARIVRRDEVIDGSLQMAGGRIAAIDPGPSAATGEGVDLEGDWLLPGLVEIHTDNFERHLMPRPKVHWSETPALLAHDAEVAAAGITTVFDALGVGDADTDGLRGNAWQPVLRTLDFCTREGLLRADHYLHVRCELPAPNTLELFEPFRGHPRVALLSLMDHTPGQRQWEKLDVARIYYTGKKGWSHDKFDRSVAEAADLQARHVEPHRRHFVDYCRTHGIALASHDDTTEAHVEEAARDGACLSEFPTTVAAARAAHRLGLRTVMGGPNVVRGGSHSGNVAASTLAREGLLDILSSDYVPASLLAAALRLVDDGLMDLPAAIATVSLHPARACGLDDRGELAPGLRADLVRVKTIDAPEGGRQAVVRGVWRAGLRVL